jgi:lipopolysaccharide transport system ATP-binding protein
VSIGSSIVVDKVSKQYEIGRARQGTMLREAIVNSLRRPWGRWRDKKETILALENVSFEVERGEVLGIVGRNGAGKSTLLKILTKITYPTSGSVTMRGRVGSLLEVGTGFHEELTGRENVYLNGSILGMKKREIDTKLDAIVDFAGVEKFMDTPIKFYSSGMRLRLGFAVAAHLDTEVLLVDEVLAVGDAEFQKRCLKKMETLHDSGRTVVFVSHNTAAVENLCPRTLWIDQGRIRRDGETRGVIREYLEHFVGAQRAGADLAQIEEREGTGEVRFTGIEFLGPRGEIRPVTRSGDRLTIRMHYHATQRLTDPQFGFSLRTDWGALAAVVSTVTSGLRIPFLPPGRGHCDVTCGPLNLMPGRYAVSLWTTGPKHFNSAKHCWDVLENCAALDIDSPEHYKSGSSVSRESGIVLLSSKWSLPAEESTEPATILSKMETRN